MGVNIEKGKCGEENLRNNMRVKVPINKRFRLLYIDTRYIIL